MKNKYLLDSAFLFFKRLKKSSAEDTIFKGDEYKKFDQASWLSAFP